MKIEITIPENYVELAKQHGMDEATLTQFIKEDIEYGMFSNFMIEDFEDGVKSYMKDMKL